VASASATAGANAVAGRVKRVAVRSARARGAFRVGEAAADALVAFAT
jgi:hypothetical protein